MPTVDKSIEVSVPVSTAYNQWTQFASFPNFMEGVESVDQLDDTHVHWRANINGSVKEWDSEITEQIPDERVAWISTSGPFNAGVVTFHHLTSEACRVMLQMEYQPEGLKESVGDMLGVVGRQIEGDLDRFKDFIERQGVETGAWRGTVNNQSETANPAIGSSSTPQYAPASDESAVSSPSNPDPSTQTSVGAYQQTTDFSRGIDGTPSGSGDETENQIDEENYSANEPTPVTGHGPDDRM